MHRDDALHELHVAHQPDVVIGEQLDGGGRADAARVERGRMDVPPFHQREHLARPATDLESLTVEGALERVQRPHDVADRPIAVVGGVGRLGAVGELGDARVGLADHLVAEVDPDQVLLEDVVVEHVFGRFTQVDDPFTQVRRLDAVRHVLVVDRTGGVVVAADTADAAGDEVGVARVLALHEDAVAAEDRRRALALDDRLVAPVDLRVDAQAADDPGDRIPGHLDEVLGLGCGFAGAAVAMLSPAGAPGAGAGRTTSNGQLTPMGACSRWPAPGPCAATWAPCPRSPR